jgi:photosystem II stability/assembly factor-like uncharacterized protein
VGEDGCAAINPFAPQYCYLYNSKGFHASTDGCKTFKSPISVGVHPVGGDMMAFDPANSSTLYAVSDTPMPAIYKSTDGGMTLAPTGWPFTAPQGIVVSPKNPNHILVVDAGSTNPTVHLSTNGGSSWTPAVGIPACQTLKVAISGKLDSTVLAAAYAGSSITILKSTDGGATFAMAPDLVPPGSASDVSSIVYSPKGNAVVTTRNGAYVSSNDGATWERLDTGPTTHNVSLAQWVAGTLYLYTYGQGVMKSRVPLE